MLERIKCCSNKAEEKEWGVKGWESYSFKQALLKKWYLSKGVEGGNGGKSQC